jgi:hypothetical protein
MSEHHTAEISGGRKDTYTDTVLRAAGGAALGIAGAVAAGSVGILAAAALGAGLGMIVPRLLSGHVVFHSKSRHRGPYTPPH